ncbi:tripartite tricarboxylate transporter substrate binding protein [Sediminicoccus sp. KRV36]|uniref:Bug family tripartite tricarboxylate transporter substrate binding protein n=1 Tax=Sediminicoccus sp. KRV36 TaxID=3133721 RepID=UPI00200DA3BB|nr:tripartite tricarboxylate transporter substrate binding protein [Sediminicoccus rosea]UPY38529.1 tripartite tricarboxylate transporter substrate binding protein [Sediminicoccus rosea]
MTARFTRRAALAGASLLPAAALAQPAVAQPAWPTRPVRIIVPFAPGGSVDTMARAIAARMAERTGQTVTVENRAGANGTVGGIAVSQAAPDGYTLLVSASVQTIARLVMRAPGYDPLTDLKPIARTGEGPCLMAINPSRPQTTMAEVAAAMRANPRDWSAGVSALGSAGHLASIEFVRQVGADVTFVPYRGTSPILVDLMGGRLGLNTDPMLAMLPPVRAGSLRGIALTAPRRNPAAPDIPTTAEAGFPSVDAHSWWAIWAPPRVPEAIAARIAAEVEAIMGEEAIRTRLSGLGIVPLFEAGAALDSYIARDFDKAQALLRLARVEPE